MKKVIVILITLVVISNLPYIKVIPSLLGDSYDCNYSNGNGKFTFWEMEAKGRTLNLAKRKFDSFKSQTSSPDTTLYRITPNNPLKFWRWYDYMTKEKYKLPYMNWSEIEKRRGTLSVKSGFQDF